MSAEQAAPAVAEEVEECPVLELVPEPGAMRLLLADLRNYLPTRAQLAVPFAGVGGGTRVLIRHGWTWLGKDGWVWDGFGKAGAVAGGIVFGLPAAWQAVVTAIGPYSAFVPTAVVICGCVAAKRYAPHDEDGAEPKPKEKLMKAGPAPAAEAAVEGPDEDEPEYLDEEPEDPIEAEEVVALIRTVAARQQHQGAHLDDLLAEPLFEGWEKADLKAALTDWGLPVAGFKLIFKTPEGKAQRNRDGVRLRHLPPAPTRGPGEGPARGLSMVPSQAPAEASVEAPVGTPPGAPGEPVVEAAVGPSPTAPAPPS
ncbi:hypothetical protein ACFWJQ_35570 [Streptomyces goshikiensis]|uniref:hypothetical protein n=1 Tax=Streptomyces goshikiensis TaxID=1942 RepID=UPI003662A092